MPNFDQFIDFLLDKKDKLTTDAHLNFFWRKCDMCHLAYDIIGKVETTDEDAQYVIFKVLFKNVYFFIKEFFE